MYCESYVIGDGPYKGLPYLGIFSITKIVGGKIVLSEEHSQYAWVTYKQMLKYNLTPEVRNAATALESTFRETASER